jgi:hypothetical protein
MARADADRCESESPRDSNSRRDLLHSHRELLYQLAALPLPRKAACRTLAKRQGAHDYFPMLYRLTGCAR